MRANFAEGEVRCGLGLIGIGKPWGVVPGEVPSDLEARRFLEGAYAAGIRYFDTAAFLRLFRAAPRGVFEKPSGRPTVRRYGGHQVRRALGRAGRAAVRRSQLCRAGEEPGAQP